jgi:hypothetical protein
MEVLLKGDNGFDSLEHFDNLNVMNSLSFIMKRVLSVVKETLDKKIKLVTKRVIG